MGDDDDDSDSNEVLGCDPAEVAKRDPVLAELLRDSRHNRKLLVRLNTAIANQHDRLLVLETRFAIVWAALAIAGSTSIGGLVTGIFALLGRHT